MSNSTPNSYFTLYPTVYRNRTVTNKFSHTDNMKYISGVKLMSRKFKSSEIDYIQYHIVSFT